MNFQQLRALRETARRGLNLTAAAESLAITQPALSKQIRELEQELGIQLFVRHGKRLTQLTEAGMKALEGASRVLDEAQNLQRLAHAHAGGEEGSLSIAATHTQARYVLPGILAQFRSEYPRMQFKLLQGNPAQVAEFVVQGEATFGLATETLDEHPSLDTRSAYVWRHCLVVPPDHPLARRTPRTELALSDLTGQPLITYSREFAGRRGIDAVFAQAGLTPRIVLEAIDSDVIKAYVELGFGVGVIADVAVDPARDTGLVRLEASGLFPPKTARIATRVGMPLAPYERRFIALLRAFRPDGEPG